MKLSKLFMIALLVGTMGVIGCGDDSTSGNGNGGNGNGGCEFTAQELCAQCDAQDKIPDCVSFFENCIVTDPSVNPCEKCAFSAASQCGI